MTDDQDGRGDEPKLVEVPDNAGVAGANVVDLESHRTNLIEELAKLDDFEYEQRRKEIAEKLNVRVTKLDKEVERARTGNIALDLGALPAMPDPWLHPVDGAALLDTAAETIRRYVILPNHAADAVALWIVHAHALDAFHISPFLMVKSATKRCGKTRLMEILGLLCPTPLMSSNISSAALFRAIEKWSPTLICDEAETWGKLQEDMRGILNSGHSRRLAFVIRADGEDNDPRRFSTWAPKALALIGSMPDTVEDRSIIVELRRKHGADKVERLPNTGVPADMLVVLRQCLRWAEDNIHALKTSNVDAPSSLNDRAQDNWAPLLTVAAVAGGNWLNRARHAAVTLSGEDKDESYAALLLADMRDIFDKHGRPVIATTTILDALGELEERPWPEYKNYKPITAAQLARLLKPFHIRPGAQRDGAAVFKGYRVADFEDVFQRWHPENAVTASQPNETAPHSDFKEVTPEFDVTAENPLKPAVANGCNPVTSPEPPTDDNDDAEERAAIMSVEAEADAAHREQ